MGNRRHPTGSLVLAITLPLSGAATCSAQCDYSVTAEVIAAPCPPFFPSLSPQDWDSSGLVVGAWRCVTADNLMVWDSTGSADPVVTDPPGMAFSRYTGVADGSLMCGEAGNLNDDVSFTTAFFQNGEELVWIPPPFGGSNFSNANGVNAQGVVVGSWGYVGASDGLREAFVWQDGKATGLNRLLGVSRSDARGVNSEGDVVGQVGSGSGGRAFSYSSSKGTASILPALRAGQFTTAQFIDDQGRIFGFGAVPGPDVPDNTVRAFSFKNGAFTEYPPHPSRSSSRPKASNAVGQVGGTSSNSAFGIVHTIWFHGDPVLLDELLEDENIFRVAALVGMQDDGRLLVLFRRFDGFGGVETFTRMAVLAPANVPQGDVSLDCSVNMHDLMLIFEQWGTSTEWADVSGDGSVGFADLLVVLTHWSG